MHNSHKWLVLFTVSIANLMTALDISIVYVSFPRLSELFSADSSVVIWIVIGYTMANLGFMLTLAKVGDALGRKKIYIIGMLLYTFGMTFCALSQNITQLIISRIIQGSGASTAMTIGPAIVVAVFPSDQRGRALGFLSMVQSAGLIGGPALGGFILEALDWQAIFYTRVPIGIIGAILAVIIIREQMESGARLNLDLGGAVTLLGGMCLLLLYFNLGKDMGYLSLKAITLAIAGIILLAFFILLERRIDKPLLDFKLFSSGVFKLAVIINLIHIIAMAPVPFLLPFFLIKGLESSASTVGILMALIAVPSVVIGPVSGWISDRIGTLKPQIFSLVLGAIGLYSFMFLDIDSRIFYVSLPVILYGTGIGIFFPSNNSAIAGSVPRETLATAMGLASTLRMLGSATSVAIAGTIFAGRQLHYKAKLVEQGMYSSLIERASAVQSFQFVLLFGIILIMLGFIIALIYSFKEKNKRST